MKILFYIIISFSILLGVIFLWGWYLLVPLLLTVIFPFFLYLLSYKLRINKIVKCILIVCFFLLSMIISFITLFYETLTDISSTWRYKWIIKNYENDIVFEHFPKKIPNYAENVKFSYFSWFLQWWWFLFLKIEVDQHRYKQIYDSFKKEELIDADIPKDNLKGYPKYRYIDEDIKNYETIILHSYPYKNSSESHYWNHWEVSWVWFNHQTYEIIYWADFW